MARSWEEAAADAEQARKAADDARHAAEEKLRQGIPPEFRPTNEQMQQSRERHGYGTHARNIAVVGESGVGKSALLNAVRGLWPEDPGAAAVGVDETTAVVQGYVDPHHPQVKWFDVPGANTPNISGWLYFMNQSLYIFDVLVILFSDRFTQTVGTLLVISRRIEGAGSRMQMQREYSLLAQAIWCTRTSTLSSCPSSWSSWFLRRG